MQSTSIPKLSPGDHIRVTQTISGRNGVWRTTAIGTVLSSESEPTGSWFAHGKKDKLWLPRIRLRKEDGEITALVINRDTQIDLLVPAAKIVP